MRIELGMSDSRAYLSIQPPLNAEQHMLISSKLGIDESVFLVNKTSSGNASETALAYSERADGTQKITEIAHQIAEVLSDAGNLVEIDATIHDLCNGGRPFAGSESLLT